MKITKQTEYAIRWLVSNGKTIDEISKELDLTIKQVSNYLTKNNLSAKKQKTAADLMITQTRDKGTKNVSIMTKEASAFGDEFRKNLHKYKKNK